jgi:ribosome-associated protein
VATSRQLAVAAARICADKKAADIAILDMRPVTYITDFFVICSVDSDRQAKAIADEVGRDFKERGLKPVGSSGYEGGQWVVADFGSVVVHVFQKAMRGFYDLEALWQDAERLPFKAPRRRTQR